MNKPKRSDKDFYDINKAYYERNAERYETASWYFFNKYKSNSVSNELERCLYFMRDKPVIQILEIGPGSGYLLEKILSIRKGDIHYTGIEHSKNMSKILADRFSNSCKSFEVINKSVSVEQLREVLKEKKFDFIIGSSILHHLPDYDKVVETLAEKLDERGIIYFVREPIHKDESEISGFLVSLLEKLYEGINNIMMSSSIRKLLWPNKVKAEDAKEIALHMFTDGVSISIFKQLAQQDFSILFIRKYNRRVSSFFSYLENKWLGELRKDIFGNTLFSIAIQNKK